LAGSLGGGAAHHPMKRCTTPRRHVTRKPSLTRWLVQRGVVELATLLSACAPPTRYEQPSGLRGYDILITRRDSLGQGIAAGLERRGFRVRRRVRGGSGPAAYLLTFTFREVEPPAVTWLHLRGRRVGAPRFPGGHHAGARPGDRGLTRCRPGPAAPDLAPLTGHVRGERFPAVDLALS